ncbi:hypothetical protein BGZ96_005337 [Linnemannia gamsii]|uniref:Shugoshin C-terminal domain-containing protein n=1 Tax=Linnemannia gamsii TaxID=64522 RepID=A0ABQ7KGL5_9FUNG|nr:hypothetical protein BGZ96_005337 [Linnemannia gamsii]
MTRSRSREQEDYTRVSSTFVSEQPVTQEWAAQTLKEGEQEEGLEEAREPTPRDTALATQFHTQRPPSLSPRRSLPQSTTQGSLDNYGIPIPSTDSQQQPPSADPSFGLSQLQCGQRLPSNPPSPIARASMDSQPYDDYVYEYEIPVRYSSDDSDNSDSNEDDDGLIVAEDSLVAVSGDTLSWSVTPQRAGEEVVDSADEDRQEDLQSDQDGIVVSTYPDRQPNSFIHSQAQSEAEVEEAKQSGEPSSPEAISESEDHEELNIRKSPSSSSQESLEALGTFTGSRKDTSSTSKTTNTTVKQARNRKTQQPAVTAVPGTLARSQRRSIPDHVKQHLSHDALDLLSHNPHINTVFLSVDIPALPVISGSKKITATTEAEAEDSTRKRVAKGFSRRKAQRLSSQSPPSPSPSLSPSPSRRSGRRPVQQDKEAQQSSRRSSLRAGAHRRISYLELEVTEDDEEQQQEQVAGKEADSDEHEDHTTTTSIHPRSVDTQRLPPKKRARSRLGA